MVICYDDTYWEPARLPALKRADIIAFVCASDRVVGQLMGPDATGTHSTIAAIEQLAAWNGLAMVASDRNNTETNPTTGETVTYGGAASIWQADGKRVAHAPATDVNNRPTNPGQILYAELDPALFDNDQKASLARRRPELYRDLAFFRAPTDPVASTISHSLTATALQIQLVAGDMDGNVDRFLRLLGEMSADDAPGLVVLPAFSVTGRPRTDEDARAWAEGSLGRTVQFLSQIAGRLNRHVVGSFIESEEGRLFHTCAVVGPDGQVVGTYRQTHLDEAFARWATAGDDLPVFDSAVGRIGMLTGEDVRFPEASAVLASRRADLIAIPASWSGEYGGWLHDAGGLFAHQYPANTMVFWYAVAKTSQAYTVVANPVGDGFLGSSGVFTINPVNSNESPVVAAEDVEQAVQLKISTLGDPTWFLNQHRLIGGRRADLAVPAMLPVDSPAFLAWRDAPGYRRTWAAYE